MNRDQFVQWGIATEVALLIIAAVLNAIWQIPSEQNPLLYSQGVGIGLAVLYGLGTGLLLSSWFWLSNSSHFQPLKRIQDFIQEQLAPPLSQCKGWEIFAIAAFAGIGEEVLFRGVLQPRVGWVIAAILFGLVHPITPTYAIVAALLGGILGLLQLYCGNLWAPIIAHGLYDYIGFYLVIHDYRKSQQEVAPNPPPDGISK